jgi:hypothetical protein
VTGYAPQVSDFADLEQNPVSQKGVGKLQEP